MQVVKPGEPIPVPAPVIVIDKNAHSFEVGAAITFQKDGVYLVSVSGNKITVKNFTEQTVHAKEEV